MKTLDLLQILFRYATPGDKGVVVVDELRILNKPRLAQSRLDVYICEGIVPTTVIAPYSPNTDTPTQMPYKPPTSNDANASPIDPTHAQCSFIQQQMKAGACLWTVLDQNNQTVHTEKTSEGIIDSVPRPTQSRKPPVVVVVTPEGLASTASPALGQQNWRASESVRVEMRRDLFSSATSGLLIGVPADKTITFLSPPLHAFVTNIVFSVV